MIESNVLVYMAYNRFALEQVGDYSIYNPRGQIVDIVGSVNGFQDFDPSKLTAMTMTTSMETHEAAIMRLLLRRDFNDQDQYYFKNSGTKAKTDDPKVTGSLDVRINRK
jgi:polyisoprenoid-binding protein YceI